MYVGIHRRFGANQSHPHLPYYCDTYRRADRQCPHQVHRQYHNVTIIVTCFSPPCLSIRGFEKQVTSTKPECNGKIIFNHIERYLILNVGDSAESLRWKLWDVVTWIFVTVWWYEFISGDTLFLRTFLMH